jgi:hypothetical protein
MSALAVVALKTVGLDSAWLRPDTRDDADAALITRCAVFHVSFERDSSARHPSDEESNRL